MHNINTNEKNDDERKGYPCYEFNESLPVEMDDGKCIHCRKYLTVQCERIDEFIDEVEYYE